jgi:hypothetical protein
MEGSTVYAGARRSDELCRTAEHLLRGAARKGEQEDPVRRDPALDEMRDAIDQRPGLAGTGARDNEQRPITVGGGGGLSLVELR